MTRGKIHTLDADHVAQWSKGGATELSSRLMLRRTRNLAKGKRLPPLSPRRSSIDLALKGVFVV